MDMLPSAKEAEACLALPCRLPSQGLQEAQRHVGWASMAAPPIAIPPSAVLVLSFFFAAG